MNQIRKQLSIAVITAPFDEVCGEANILNLLQMIKPLSNNLFAVTGKLTEYPDKTVKIIRLKGGQTEGRCLLFKILDHILVDLQISVSLLRIYRCIDVVAFHIGARAYLLSVLLSKLMRKKLVAFSFSRIHKIGKIGADHKVFKKSMLISLRLAAILENVTLSLADQIAVESESVIKFSGLERFKNKISIYGAQYMDFSLFQKKRDLKDRKKLVGYIGSLTELKGVMELARAIPLILKEQSDVEFLIGGDGPLSRKINEVLRVGEASGKVKIISWIPHDEVPRYLNQMMLLVLPSYTEGIPGIIQEAMACGTPVLATPVGGIPDLIKDGETGFIMEDNSPECIARNAIRALNHPNLEEITQNARNLIEREYSYEAMVEKFKQALEKLVKT